MIRPELLRNMQVTPAELNQLDAVEHGEIPHGSCITPGQQINDKGDLLVPAHEWRESVCEDRGEDEDEPEAS